MSPERQRWNRVRAASILALLLLVGFAGRQPTGEEPRVPAAPSVELAATGDSLEVAVLAGGCFWGVQGVFQHVKGVTAAVSGSAGGEGGSGYAESVQVTFDPRQISYDRLLQLFFSVVHDPTELNRQGPDEGPEYRSAIFPQDGEQEKVARAYIAELEKAHAFADPIVTTIELGHPFYRAADDQQDYLALHPSEPYIVYNDLPKIAELQRRFPELYRADPVLVASR